MTSAGPIKEPDPISDPGGRNGTINPTNHCGRDRRRHGDPISWIRHRWRNALHPGCARHGVHRAGAGHRGLVHPRRARFSAPGGSASAAPPWPPRSASSQRPSRPAQRQACSLARSSRSSSRCTSSRSTSTSTTQAAGRTAVDGAAHLTSSRWIRSATAADPTGRTVIRSFDVGTRRRCIDRPTDHELRSPLWALSAPGPMSTESRQTLIRPWLGSRPSHTSRTPTSGTGLARDTSMPFGAGAPRRSTVVRCRRTALAHNGTSACDRRETAENQGPAPSVSA